MKQFPKYVFFALMFQGLRASQAGNVQDSLKDAAKRGDCSAIHELVNANASLDKPGSNNQEKPLQLAARNGHVEAINLLVALKASPEDMGNETGWRPLYEALRNKHAGAVHALLDLKASTDNQWGHSVWTAAGGDIDCIEAFIAHEVPPLRKDGHGRTIFDSANLYYNCPLLHVLINNYPQLADQEFYAIPDLWIRFIKGCFREEPLPKDYKYTWGEVRTLLTRLAGDAVALRSVLDAYPEVQTEHLNPLQRKLVHKIKGSDSVRV